MGSSQSRAGGNKALSGLVAVLLATGLYVAYKRFNTKGTPSLPDPRRGALGTATSSSKPKAKGGFGDPEQAKGPLRGPAPQKIDIFVDLVTGMYPDSITDQVARQLFPRKFESHGHVVVVRMNPNVTVEVFKPLAEAFAQSFAPIDVDVVLLDSEGIVGELRRPKLEVLFARPREEMMHLVHCPRAIKKRWGESREAGLPTLVPAEDLEALLDEYTQSDTYAVHVENGVRYGFDVQKVMFCSGNVGERMHFATVNATGETVVDMFAGIGYFSLPLAMHGHVSAIHAIDKNPDSIAFLRLNAVQNHVDHVIHTHCGDNLVVQDELGGRCDRVLMGLIPTCKSFLPRAAHFLKKNAEGRPVGVIHYHFLADKPDARRTALDDAKEALGEATVAGLTIADLRCVKSYAPKRFHHVADFTFA